MYGLRERRQGRRSRSHGCLLKSNLIYTSWWSTALQAKIYDLWVRQHPVHGGWCLLHGSLAVYGQVFSPLQARSYFSNGDYDYTPVFKRYVLVFIICAWKLLHIATLTAIDTLISIKSSCSFDLHAEQLSLQPGSDADHLFSWALLKIFWVTW